MDIMDCEQAGDFALAGKTRYQAGHPVIAMDQVGLQCWNDVVDHFPLESQADLYTLAIVAGIDLVAIKENPVRAKCRRSWLKPPSL